MGAEVFRGAVDARSSDSDCKAVFDDKSAGEGNYGRGVDINQKPKSTPSNRTSRRPKTGTGLARDPIFMNLAVQQDKTWDSFKGII